MTRILLIPCGKTFWTEEGRLAGSAEMPLSHLGHEETQECARRLAESEKPRIIYTGKGQAEKETLRIVSKSLGVKTKVLEGLEEPDMGLWEGLTIHDLQQRSPKAYKQLTEQPSQVNPPSGEPLVEAVDRLVACIDRVTEKHKDAVVGLVVGPLAEFLLESWIRSEQFAGHWAGRQPPEIAVIGGGGTIIPEGDRHGIKTI